jgi:uncharacterized protein YndB with AHSA1/START domain
MVAVTTAQESLRLRVRTDADPDTVFKALTDGDELVEWFAESAHVDLAQSRYEFWGRYTPQGDRPRQALTGHEPGRALRFTWSFDEGPSTVEITLGADGQGTVVAVAHDGIRTDTVSAKCFWYVTLANLAASSEGRQTMPPFDFSVPAQGDALVRTVIDVPVDEVYAALLDPERVSRVVGVTATIEPKVGGRYTLAREGYGPERIVELDPDKTLAYTWRNHGGGESVVRWSLRSSRGSTYLTLLHSDITDDALAERYRRGWPPYLVELKRLLELGPSWQPLSG